MTREEAIRRLERLLNCGDGTYEFKVEINTDDQKAIQLAIASLEVDEALEQEPRWIPVSERLPDKNKYDKGAVWERSVLVTAYFSWDSSKHTFISTKLAEDVVANNFVDECIVAWMPLPKAYSDMLCTQKCCLKNHDVGVIECNEEYCSNRTKF